MATREPELLRNARVGNATVRGRRASVSVDVPGDNDDGDPLLAIKEGGRWGLIAEESLSEDRGEATDRERRGRAQGRACPRGTPLVRAIDLVDGLPPGYELAQATEAPPLVDVLRVALRGRLRRAETKVLLRRRHEIGTSLTVLNSRERQSEDGFLADTLAGAQAAGAARPKPVDIAGGKGAFVATSGGAFAAAQIAPCASVLLVDSGRARLLRAVRFLSAPQGRAREAAIDETPP